MKKTAALFTILVFALTACVPNADDPVNSALPTSIPAEENPASSPAPVEPNAYAPQLSDASLTRGEAFLDFKEILSLESFPLQFTLHLTGSLPTPCHQLRVDVNAPDLENKVQVEVYSVSNPDKICTQVIVPFDVNISLGSFPAGKYSLWVNGEMAAEFQS